MKAWHFTADTLRDGRLIPANGVKLKHAGPMILCGSGLHASPTPWEALQYAPGEHLFLVECGGEIVVGDDKLICSERTIIARMDATPLLRYFARQQALSVSHLWEPPQVVLDYLMGDDAARAAASDATWAAARAAAGAAARAAAGAAARAAAMDATWAAAWAATWAATWAAARDEFNQLVYYAFEDWL